MITMLKRSVMFFHYGNCKAEIQQYQDKIKLLEEKVVYLLGEIHEGKAMYDYQVGVLEKRVSDLQVETGARKCVCETMAEEVANLHRIISRKDDALKEQNEQISRLKEKAGETFSIMESIAASYGEKWAELDKRQQIAEAHKALSKPGRKKK